MNHNPDKITWMREFLVTQLNHWMLFPVYIVLVGIILTSYNVTKQVFAYAQF